MGTFQEPQVQESGTAGGAERQASTRRPRYTLPVVSEILIRKLQWLPSCPSLKPLLPLIKKTVRKPLPAAFQSYKLLQTSLLLVILKGLLLYN
jgi:hypothetical protein